MPLHPPRRGHHKYGSYSPHSGCRIVLTGFFDRDERTGTLIFTNSEKGLSPIVRLDRQPLNLPRELLCT